MNNQARARIFPAIPQGTLATKPSCILYAPFGWCWFTRPIQDLFGHPSMYGQYYHAPKQAIRSGYYHMMKHRAVIRLTSSSVRPLLVRLRPAKALRAKSSYTASRKDSMCVRDAGLNVSGAAPVGEEKLVFSGSSKGRFAHVCYLRAGLTTVHRETD